MPTVLVIVGATLVLGAWMIGPTNHAMTFLAGASAGLVMAFVMLKIYAHRNRQQ
jgi:positive regulator of sigma E activity